MAAEATSNDSREIAAEKVTSPEDHRNSSAEVETIDTLSERVVQVVVPVTLCALYCIALIRVLSWNLTPSQPNIIDSTWERLGINVKEDLPGEGTNVSSYLIIVSIFVALIIFVTLMILLVFYLEWQRCLFYYFYLPSLIILAVITPAFLRTILHSLNWFPLDLITVLVFLWNFVALGMMAIFSLFAAAPLCLQQFYLIHNSAMLSVLIIHALPGWAPWLLLAFLVLWDLFAVLAPYGPLNLIIDLAQKEGIVEMPGLLYSTSTHPKPDQEEKAKPEEKKSVEGSDEAESPNRVIDTIKSDDESADEQKKKTPTVGREAAPAGKSVGAGKFADLGKRVRSSASGTVIGRESARYESDILEKGVSIGLGDFIFYSLLVGLTAKGRELLDFYAVLTTLVSVQFGLILTLVILAATKRALPALPISIGLGISTAALTIQFVPHLSNRLACALVFV